MSVLIKGGRVVTAADDYVADIYVEGERISLIGESLDAQADRIVDASGKYVFPGCVDPHTHLDMPFGGTVTIDDVESGQTSAAAGGTTCHVDFVIQPKGATFAEALEEWRGKANGKQVIDMGYHMAVTDLKEGGSLEELAGLPDQGVTSYKLFMAYKGALMVDDETLFRTMEVAADTGALVMVHAENGDAIDVLVKKALAEGHTGPHWHALTRPPETEGEATNRAIQLARVAGCALYVVHVSCAEAVEPIQLAREKGWNVHGETCTQYFFVDETFLERPDFEGAKFVYTPPPRAKANQDVLWNAVRTDTLSAISTDHCAFNWDGQKTLGRDDFSKIPNGGPGLENRLHMIHEFGVRAGRISLNRMVELLCTNPAKLFGLYPRKGTIAVGSDADIVVFDPEKHHLITAATQHSKTDYNLYEGTEVTGSPEVVLLRGNVLVENDELVATPGGAHLSIAETVASAALPALIEKPPAPDADGARRLAALRPAPWIGFNRRFFPGVAALRGRETAHLRVVLHYRRVSWKPFEVQDDALLDVGTHAIDLVRWVGETDVRRVRATALHHERCELELELARGTASVSCATDRVHREVVEARDAAGKIVGRDAGGGLARAI